MLDPTHRVATDEELREQLPTYHAVESSIMDDDYIEFVWLLNKETGEIDRGYAIQPFIGTNGRFFDFVLLRDDTVEAGMCPVPTTDWIEYNSEGYDPREEETDA